MHKANPPAGTARSAAVSTCRCVAMIMILACHFLQFYNNELAWWLNVGVQMFLFLSGFLYGGKNIGPAGQFLVKNFKKICIPYYCFLLPVLLLYALFANEHLSLGNVISALLCVGTVKGLNHLWFISYILLCYLLTPVLAVLVERWKHLPWGSFLGRCLLIVAVGQLCTLPIYSVFYFSRVACYMTGYFAAVFFARYGEKLFKQAISCFILLAVAANTLRIIVRYVLKLDIPGFGLFEQYAHLLLGAALVLALIRILESIQENRLLVASDRYSYCIYIVHHLFILSPFTLMEATAFPPLNWLLVILASCACAAVLKPLADKVINLLSLKRT